MGKYCCAINCKEKFIKGGLVTLHCFPKDKNRRILWEIKIRRENFKATDATRICSKHFTPESFESNKLGGTWLKKDAVPTIFDFPAHLQKKVFTRKPRKLPKEDVRKLLKEDVDVQEGPSKKILVKGCLGTDDSTADDSESFNKQKTDVDVLEGSPEQGARKRFCYFGDFTENDMNSPREAKKMFNLATMRQKAVNTKLKSLRNQNFKLKKRVASLKKIVQDFKKNRLVRKPTSHTLKSNEKEVTFISGNAGKTAEVKAILGDIVKVNCVKLDLPEYQGDSDFITSSKCKSASEIVSGRVIVEDVSLCFRALNGLPGPYIKWFLDKLRPSGLVKLLDGWEDKTATAVCTFAYSEGTEYTPILFHGFTKGTIVPPRGSSGFGWDSCFLPKGYDKTYAEMSNEVKNEISHRRKALNSLYSFLEQKANIKKENCDGNIYDHVC